MKRQRLFALPFVAALISAAAATTSLAWDRAPTWGWKEDEGGGASRKARPTQQKGVWQPKVADPKPDQPVPSKSDSAAAPVRAPEPPPANVKAYCENIADPALDARFLHQKAELARLEGELAQKTALLEEKKAEFQRWLKRRDDFVAKAQDNLLKLYSKIKPDAAAPQLAAMDEEAAAALLSKLSARTSSAILDQMDSVKAARLVSVMIGAARPSDQPPPPVKSPPQNASTERDAERGGEAAEAQDDGKS